MSRRNDGGPLCTVHRQYKAVRRPTADCSQCREAWVMEQRRVGFEAFVSGHIYLCEFTVNRDPDHLDEYAESEIQTAWEAWNAALDSVVIAKAKGEENE